MGGMFEHILYAKPDSRATLSFKVVTFQLSNYFQPTQNSEEPG